MFPPLPQPGLRPAIARGANDYVPKPVDVDQLLTVVCALLDPEGEAGAASEDITVADLTGVGVQDAAIASLVLRAATRVQVVQLGRG